MDYYKNDDLLSASKLIAFSVHPKNYKYFSYGKADTKSLNIGNIVDCLLTEPDQFNKKYIILDIDQSSKEYKFAEEVYNLYKGLGCITDAEILIARTNSGFDGRLNDSRIISLYDSKIKPLVDKVAEVKKFTTKEVIDQATYDTCMKVVTSIQTHPFTQLDKGYEKEDQCIIKWKLNGFDCKSKLDILLIDHKNKRIQIKDIKTTGYGTNAFRNSILKYRYDLQGAFYWMAVRYLYPDYTIESVEFIVESTVYPGTPLIYRIGDNLLYNSIDTIHKLTNDLMWHIDTDRWDYPREVYENNGVILVNELN